MPCATGPIRRTFQSTRQLPLRSGSAPGGPSSLTSATRSTMRLLMRCLRVLSSAMTGSSSTLPDLYQVPSGGRPHGRLQPPPSKSLTHRFLALALLSRSPVRLVHPLFAEDTRLFMAALEQCGWLVEESAEDVVLTPPVTSHPAAEVEIACGNCGTMLRLLVAALCAVPGKFV